MTSPRINNSAILLALGDWERRSIPPPIDHDTLVRLGGACLRIGLPLFKAAEGRRSAEIERLCVSAVFARSNRALTPSSTPEPSASSYIADVVTVGLASYSVVRLCRVIGPSTSEVPPRSWRHKAHRIIEWLRSADRRRVNVPEVASQELGGEIRKPPATDEIASSALSGASKTGGQSCYPSLPSAEGSAGTKRKLSLEGDNLRLFKRPRTDRSPLVQEKQQVEGGKKKETEEEEKQEVEEEEEKVMKEEGEKEMEGGEKKETEGAGKKEVQGGEKSTTSCDKALLIEEETLLEGPTQQALVGAVSQEVPESVGPQA